MAFVAEVPQPGTPHPLPDPGPPEPPRPDPTPPAPPHPDPEPPQPDPDLPDDPMPPGEPLPRQFSRQSTRSSRGLGRSSRPTFAIGRPSSWTMSAVKSLLPVSRAEPTP